MKIQQIQSQTFEAKKRYLNLSQLYDAKTLLTRMNAETEYKSQGTVFTSRILGALKINDNALFMDGRYLCAPSPIIEGHSTLEIGKTKVTFDNESGEVLKLKKPLFKPWHKVMDDITETLRIAKQNFNNKEVVEKRFVGIRGVTQKGANIIEEAQKLAFKKIIGAKK